MLSSESNRVALGSPSTPSRAARVFQTGWRGEIAGPRVFNRYLKQRPPGMEAIGNRLAEAEVRGTRGHRGSEDSGGFASIGTLAAEAFIIAVFPRSCRTSSRKGEELPDGLGRKHVCHKITETG